VFSTRAVRQGAGSSRLVLALARGFADAGDRVDIVADRLDAPAVRAAGARPVHPLRAPVLQRLARRFLSRERQLALRARAVARLGAGLVVGEGDLPRQDVVLVHNIVRREVEALGAAATAEQEAIAVAQERALRANAYRLAVVGSELTGREFAARFGCAPERIAVVRPGVDPAQFSPRDRPALRAATRSALGIGPAETVVAFVTSGHFRLRGVDALAATLARLGEAERSGLRLLAVGSERNAQLLREALAGAPVTCAPRVPRVEAYYHAADILFHPAHFETFGLVVAEAAACGCAVLTSRSVGAAEIFSGEGAAAVAARPDAAEFLPLLSRLLHEPEWRASVAASQAHAAGTHTWARYAVAFRQALHAHGLAGA